MRRVSCSRIRPRIFPFWLLAVLAFSFATAGQQRTPQGVPEVSRPARNWEFLPVVGSRAGLFGNETGTFEAWVYPLKILRDFHLLFHTNGRLVPAEALARTVTVRPESCSILYADDAFQVRETLFVPEHEPGAVITLEVDTTQPLEVEAAFQRDFQLEWPAAVGGTYLNWDQPLHSFFLGEEQKKFAAFVGSPSAVLANEEYATNYSASATSSFLLGPTLKGKETKVVVIAASVQGAADAEQVYKRLSSDYAALLKISSDYYHDYLDRTVQLELPDAQLQQAYDWSRVSMVQGLVTNPYLGTGLIAGYRTSGGSQRPGFAWYFGRDSLWTDLALDAAGDFKTVRTALDFVSKYQRSDGKIPHEISQSASLVPWFQDYPYAYASADATPLYLIAMQDYVARSGDVSFARQKWESVWKAYQFLKSTYDAQNLPQNFGIGHGWVEGGPLLPVNTELYQSGLGAQALRDLASLAHIVGKEDVSRELEQSFSGQQSLLNQAFWSADKKMYGFALNRNNERVDTASVLATVPMWFGLLDEDKTEMMLNLLAEADHQTDWGMRIISSRDPRYDPGGYHFGSVWPLFTGWASVGEYRYHRALPAYGNLRANALMAMDGSPGHVTEVLSGNYYQPLSTSSPHQVWSAAMVVSPILRGMLGLEVNALSHRVAFAPHIPYDWNALKVKNLRAGDCTLDFGYQRTMENVSLEVSHRGKDDCEVEFSPSVSLGAEALAADVNGHKLAFTARKSTIDQHVVVRFPVSSGANKVSIRIRNDFGLFHASNLPALGSTSEGLRVVSESWSAGRDALTINLAGRPGHVYRLGVWNPGWIGSVEGASLENDKGSPGIRVEFAGNVGEDYAHTQIVIHSAKRPRSR